MAATKTKGVGRPPRFYPYPDETSKVCSQCGVRQPYEDFRFETRRGRYRSECRYCMQVRDDIYREAQRAKNSDFDRKQRATARVSVRRRIYGLDAEAYIDLVIRQAGGCAVCGGKQQRANRLLAIDHNHETGAVRGLLCDECNKGLGMFRDRPDLLARAIDYLVKHMEVAA